MSFWIKIFLISVWLINGLFCKVLGMVPRHEEIVARILGKECSSILTIMIGIGEIAVAIWIWSNIKSKWCGWFQICMVGTMNIIEYFFAKDLLLWGSLNSVFALMFIGIVYFQYFHSKSLQ